MTDTPREDAARVASSRPRRVDAARPGGDGSTAGTGPPEQGEADLAEQAGWPGWLEHAVRCLAALRDARPAASMKWHPSSRVFRAGAAAAALAAAFVVVAVFQITSPAARSPANVVLPAGNPISVEDHASLTAAVADCTALNRARLAQRAGIALARPVTDGALAVPAGHGGARLVVSGLPDFCAVIVSSDGRPRPHAGQVAAQAWLPLPPAWNGRFKVFSALPSISSAAAALRAGYAAMVVVDADPGGHSLLILEGERASSAFYGVPQAQLVVSR